MIDAQQVIEIHDLILRQEPGLAGGHGVGPLEGALAPVASRMLYGQLSDVAEGTLDESGLASLLFSLAIE